MKRLLSFLSLLIVAVSSFAQQFTVGDLTYSILSTTDKTVQVYNGKIATGDVIVPETVTYNEVEYSVTTIAASAFSSNKNITSISLPSVTSIGRSAFSGCSSLASVELPTATSIGSSAFSDCSSLASVELPTATSIGSEAFYSCSSLTSISLPSATSIGYFAFAMCSKISSLRIGSVEQWCNVKFEGSFANPLQAASLTVELHIGDSETPATNIAVPNTLTSIPDYAFCKTSITSVAAPGVTSVGGSAFYGCSSLVSVELPAATSIGDGTFASCDALTSIDLPAAINISSSAFSRCYALTSIHLPVATTIESYAFYFCTKLNSVDLPLATTIGDHAFYECSEVESMNLPKVKTVGKYAFESMYAIKYLSIPEIETIGEKAFYSYSSKYGPFTLRIGSIEQYCNIVYQNDASQSSPLATHVGKNTLLIGDSNEPVTEITIPKSIQQIEPYAFAFSSIHTIHFESTTPPILINKNSFNANIMLAVPEEAYETYLAADIYKTIPLQITIDSRTNQNIDMEAAAGTSNLLAKIGENEVRYVVNLKITGTINSYDMLIIRNQMPSLRNLDLTDASIVDCDYIYSNANGTNYRSQKDVITAEWLSGIMNLKLPTSTKSIADRAFYSNTRLVSVTIPEGVTSIGTYAFYGCNNIKQLTIPQSVTSFGSYAFQSCTGLKEIVIPNGVTSLSSNAFYNCTDLEKVTIPASVTTIGSYAFRVSNPLELHISSLDAWLNVQNGSESFTSVSQLFIGDTDEPTEDLVIPEGTTNLKNYAFAGFKCLKSVSFPEELTTIGIYAFSNCSGLTDITLPTSVTAISGYTFQGCSNLKNVEFTDGIKTIGSYAFSGCSKLTKIELPAYLKSIGSYAFQNCSNLAEVLIPASITEIKDYAFSGCKNLNRVIATTVEPVKINQNTFSTYQTATLFTPKTSYYKYYWNTQYNQFLGGRKEYDKEFAKSFGYKYFYLNGVNGDNNEDFEISDETGPLHGVGDDHPDADFNEGAGMIVGGEQIQNLGDIHIHHNGNNGASVIAKNSGKVHIDNLYVDIKTQKNRWYFFCFPFDIKPGEATYDGSHVWYLYDGEARALNGNGGWKKVANDGVMKSGNGYIFQGAVNGTLTIHVSDITIDTNDASTNMITYQSDNKNDASWNLIGNANFAYYDIDNLGYDAPITVYNNETGNYEAVRTEDEDYEFYPFQAFFVQKPEGTDAMTFEAKKKETKNKSDENQARRAAARAGAPKKVDPSRKLINLELSAVDLTEDAETAAAADRTRIVVNAAKSLAYEPECDAAKFIADGMPQIYSLDAENTMYAINERPAADGIVPLAVKITEEGFYTISASRLDCAAQLRDLETGDVIDLAEGDYTFAAKAKTYTQRFQLLLADAVEGIEAIEVADAISVEAGAISVGDARADVKIYTAGGVLVAAQKGIGSVKVPAGVYVVNVNGQSTKVTVKE